MDLKRLILHNFISFESCEVEFKGGLYLISGYNTLGQDSNGSGKSAFLNGICFALFGRTSTGLTTESVKMWGAKGPMVVSLELEDGADLYRITRTENDVEFVLNGQPIGGHKRDVQRTIEETFKTSYDIFTSSTFFSQGRVDHLAASTDATKKKLFKAIFQLDRIDKAYMLAKTKYDDTRDKWNQLEMSRIFADKLIGEGVHKLADLEGRATNFSLDVGIMQSHVREKIGGISLAPNPYLEQDLEISKSQLEELTQTSMKGEEAYPLLQEELITKQGRKDYLKVLYGELSDTLATIQSPSWNGGATCKYCGEVMNKRTLSLHKRELIMAEEACVREGTELDKDIIDLNSKILARAAIRDRIHNVTSTIAVLESKISADQIRINQSKKTIEAYEQQLATMGNQKNPYLEMIVALKADIEAKQVERAQLIADRDATSKAADVWSFLKWVLSKEGVTSHIVERAFGRLESLSNRYLSLLSAEGFHVEIRPQRETKTQGMKEEIEILVRQGTRKINYWQLSAGQRQKLDIGILLAIYRLCRDMGTNNFNFILLDEVLDLSLAERGQDAMIGLMRRLLNELRAIVIISHKEDLKKDFDYVIEVRRDEKGVSKIE